MLYVRKLINGKNVLISYYAEIKIYLTKPIANFLAERTFSKLARIKKPVQKERFV